MSMFTDIFQAVFMSSSVLSQEGGEEGSGLPSWGNSFDQDFRTKG